MASPSKQSFHDDASNLLRQLLSHYNPDYGLGHMSPSIYDTAWVSMVSKDNTWLFPSSFQYILGRQSPSGGWESPSLIDSILNTLSCLLSLKYHSADGDFSSAVDKAQAFLSSQLHVWDVPSTERVGFEITIPAMLCALSHQGINFKFPHHALLMDLNRTKLSKLKPQVIYSQPTPVLHSLEGLIGHIDFDKVAHHKRNGSFMASPSSTAAYLMHASVWDDECEAYLREVLSQYEIYGAGSVPPAWPTTFFELSWVVCTLHDCGFDFDKLDQNCCVQISEILKQGYDNGKGVVGFASNVPEDADDTAKTVTALHHLETRVSLRPMRNTFELEDHFRCYPFERNTSITVQCNVLSALLQATESYISDGIPDTLRASILKVVTFISEAWWTTNEEIEDKWHDSKLYPLLLIAQSLTKFMHLFDMDCFSDFPELVVQTKAPVALFQILMRVLQAQDKDSGSWGTCEETAYAILALTTLASLPFVSIMHPIIQLSLDSGRRFLLSNTCDAQDTNDKACLWIDKISYRIPPVSYSYVLAALYATSTPLSEPSSSKGGIARLISIPADKVKNHLRFYRRMPLYYECQDWQLFAYIAEAFLYKPILEEVRKMVFGRELMGKEPYMEHIPICWTSANAVHKKYSCPQNMFVLMTMSLVNFQVDEFFDSMVQDEGTAALPALRQALNDIFDALNQGKDITNMDFSDRPYAHMIYYVHKYTCFVVNYPTAQRASYYDKTHLRRELKAYLLSMVQQTEDNTVYAAQTSWDTFINPEASYLKWVRTLGAEHISGFVAAGLFICHLAPDTDVFPTPEIKFIAQDCITHMCVTCRIWNDWGSMTRDIAERNINGMNFPEFAGMNENEVKAQMKRISDYGLRCLHRGLEELRMRAKEVMGDIKGEKWADAFELFFRGAKVFNAIYEFKDISAWKLSLLNGH